MTAHLSTGPRMILEENEEVAQNRASPSLQPMVEKNFNNSSVSFYLIFDYLKFL